MNDAPRWRRIVGSLLLVLGCVLVPLSLSAVWVRDTLLDTDTYVSTVGPLASNPQIQEALASRVADGLFARADVNQKITDALPAKADFLGEPIANAVHTATENAALRLVESERFQTLWENANRRAHGAVVKVLTGGGSRVSTENGTVSIELGQIVDNVKQKLDAKGITVFDDVTVPPSKEQLVLFQSEDLEKVQGAVDLLQTVAWVLPFLALACFAGAIGLSRHRRRTIQRGAIGVAAAVAVQLVLLKTGRSLYLDAVTTTKSTPGAAGAVWDQVTSFLRTSGLVAIVVALLIAFAAWVVGPSSPAVRLRATWHRVLRTSRGSADGTDSAPGPVAAFVARSKNLLRGVGVALAFVVLIAWSHPTVSTVLVVALALLVYLALLEFLGRSARTEQSANAPS